MQTGGSQAEVRAKSFHSHSIPQSSGAVEVESSDEEEETEEETGESSED